MMRSAYNHIVIEGNIGSGKTTLVTSEEVILISSISARTTKNITD
jgi:deoxyadenosine/deoxycytidine kinase